MTVIKVIYGMHPRVGLPSGAFSDGVVTMLMHGCPALPAANDDDNEREFQKRDEPRPGPAWRK